MRKSNVKPEIVTDETGVKNLTYKKAKHFDQHDLLQSIDNSCSLTIPPEITVQIIDGAKKEGFVVSWRNLSYYIDETKWYKPYGPTKQPKQILNNVSGSFRSGELSAIIGPSGAGKSTLINCLTRKNKCGILGRTKVKFADPASGKRSFQTVIVPQKTHLFDTLTITEAFMFASRLKNAHLTYENRRDQPMKSNGRDCQPFDHLSNVNRVIKQLDLESCSRLRCGKLSGGQYKRVSIGLDLLSRPQFMILDEPTSGLDSVGAYETLHFLKNLAGSSDFPICIVAIVHQPGIELINMFDKLYVIANEGRAIYEGPTDGILSSLRLGLRQLDSKHPGEQQQSIPEVGKSSISSLHAKLDQPAQCQVNPFRAIIEVASGLFGSELMNIMASLQAQKSIGIGEASENKFDSNPKVELDNVLSSSIGCQRRITSRVFFDHVSLHAKRSWLTIIRDPIFFALQFILHMIVPSFLGYSFYNYVQYDACPIAGPVDVIEESYRPNNALKGLQNEMRSIFENMGFTFLTTYVLAYSAICATALTYPLTLQVLLREYRNGWYSLSSYFLGRTVADLPVPILNIIIASAISYYSTDQPHSDYEWRFIYITILAVLVVLVAQTHGLIVGALLMDRAHPAIFFGPVSCTPFFVICGFLVRIRSIPKPLQFLSQLSYPTHLMNGFVILRYGFNRCPCDEEQFEIDPMHVLSDRQRKVTDPWVGSFKSQYLHKYENHSLDLEEETPDLIGKLISIVSNAKTYGYTIESCDQNKAFAMFDYNLNDGDLSTCFVSLIIMYFVFRLLAYIFLARKINSRL